MMNNLDIDWRSSTSYVDGAEADLLSRAQAGELESLGLLLDESRPYIYAGRLS